jgi:hypothetical protein
LSKFNIWVIKRRLLTILSWESVRFSSYMGIQARAAPVLLG